MLHQYVKWLYLVLLLSIASFSCEKEEIIPKQGFEWPETTRSYWPTNGWQIALPEDHGLNKGKLEIAHQFAASDTLARALLIVKDGYLVFERYYGDGNVNESTNLWSVTKSITSAMVGFLMDDGLVQSADQKMKDLMPDYPDFKEFSLHHVLTHTTGLHWSEVGLPWVNWIFSDNWVQSALDRGFRKEPGEEFFYSSGNSHFLTALVKHKTGVSPGLLAKERLFNPLGIPFEPLTQPINYTNWEEYIPPLRQSWRQDPNGIETAGFGLYLTARDMAKFGYLFLNRGEWDGQQILSNTWIELSTEEHEKNIYGRYSYAYHWWITLVDDVPVILASGYGGQIIGVIPSLDMVVVLKYEAENPEHPEAGTEHDDMGLFELVVQAVDRE